MAHIPVLLNEVINFLNPKNGDTILDATTGEGGHAKKIIGYILPDGVLIGVDQDKQFLDKLISNSQHLISKKKIILIGGNFRDLDKLLQTVGIKSLDGALFDLGMNSLQLEESGRGFTFQKDEPLLMTYKYPIGVEDLTAGKILNEWSEKDIADILYKYGEERYAKRIARNIIGSRRKSPFKTTFDLVATIKKSVPFRHYYKINPATKTFQALRIAVNDELGALGEGLEKAWKFLVPGSRLVVISFHSLEDRAVKRFFSAKGGSASSGEKQGIILTKKPVVPSVEEIVFNPRSRSAKLRAATKI